MQEDGSQMSWKNDMDGYMHMHYGDADALVFLTTRTLFLTYHINTFPLFINCHKT